MGCIASGRTRACDALRQKPHQEAGFSPAVFTSGLCGSMTGAPLSLCTAPSLGPARLSFSPPSRMGSRSDVAGPNNFREHCSGGPGRLFSREFDLLMLPEGYVWVRLYLRPHLESWEISWQKNGHDEKNGGCDCTDPDPANTVQTWKTKRGSYHPHPLRLHRWF